MTNKPLHLAARKSRLSQMQVVEVMQQFPELAYTVTYLETYGDKDKKRSLRDLEPESDFFTRELDDYLIEGRCDATIHSAKDLPKPLRSGIMLAALTEGIDPRDALVFREGESLSTLPKGAFIGSSSLRRVQNVLALRDDLNCLDIRGTIEERLNQLYEGKFDAVVIAEAALIRLQLNPNRIYLPGESTPLQGKLAITVREEDSATADLFKKIDARYG